MIHDAHGNPVEVDAVLAADHRHVIVSAGANNISVDLTTAVELAATILNLVRDVQAGACAVEPSR